MRDSFVVVKREKIDKYQFLVLVNQSKSASSLVSLIVRPRAGASKG